MTYTTIHFPWKAAELSLFIYALKKKKINICTLISTTEEKRNLRAKTCKATSKAPTQANSIVFINILLQCWATKIEKTI